MRPSAGAGAGGGGQDSGGHTGGGETAGGRLNKHRITCCWRGSDVPEPIPRCWMNSSLSSFFTSRFWEAGLYHHCANTGGEKGGWKGVGGGRAARAGRERNSRDRAGRSGCDGAAANHAVNQAAPGQRVLHSLQALVCHTLWAAPGRQRDWLRVSAVAVSTGSLQQPAQQFVHSRALCRAGRMQMLPR